MLEGAPIIRTIRRLDVARHLPRALCTVLVLLVLLSAFRVEDVPTITRVAMAGVIALALVRPGDALLVVAALAPFGLLLGRIGQASALNVTEVLVLAFLAGVLIRTWPRADGDSPRARWRTPFRLFVIAALASCAVMLARINAAPLVGLSIGTTTPWALLHELWLFLGRDYFVVNVDYSIARSSLLFEGLALVTGVVALARVNRSLAARGVRMLVAGGVGVSLLSLASLGMFLMRAAAPLQALARVPNEQLRFSAHVPDFNAAGSYLALVWLAALGLAAAGSKRTRVAWLAASAPIAAAMWASGSRSALAACPALLVAAVLYILGASGRPALGRRSAAIGIALAIVLAFVAFRYFPRGMTEVGARDSLHIRRAFLVTSLRMLATRPVFGVGIGLYYPLSGSFMPPDLRAQFTLENAHNYFLQIGAELGLVGLALFLWLVIAIGRHIWTGFRASRVDLRFAGLVAGIAAFSVTCLTGHPLLVPEVACPFWIGLGLAIALADAAVEAPEAAPANGPLARPHTPTGRRTVPWPRLAVAAVAIVLLASIPLRARAEIRSANLTGVSAGFSEWDRDASSVRFRWIARHATFYVPTRARAVEIPLRAGNTGGHDLPVEVEIRLDGRLANRVPVVDDAWFVAHLVIPPVGSRRFRRVDLRVDRTGLPAARADESAATHLSGVKVGRLTTRPLP